MKKARTLKIISILTLLTVLLQPTASLFMATAAQSDSLTPYRIVIERDSDGNLLPEYTVDSRGNIVETDMSPSVSSAASLPDSFDLREYNYVTPVKNQAGAGSCWAFAAISSLESSMIKQGYKTASTADYSEAHLSWFGKRQRSADPSDPTYGEGEQVSNPFISGGYWLDASNTLMRGSGLQLEANAPWTETQSESVMLSTMTQPESDRYACYARLFQTQNVYDKSIDTAKNLLMSNGNLELSYYHDDTGFNSYNACYYQNKTNSSNHAVAVIGWNDNYSRNSFNSSMRPTKDGAWLVKGSWGNSFGSNGYYWISYYDTSVHDILSYVAAPVDIYDNIYQYDGAPSLTYFSGTRTIATANRFKSQRDEMLTHVGFFHHHQKPVNLTVEVYISNSGYAPTTSTDPAKNMTLVSSATTSVSNSYAGYYTIRLNNPVKLYKNDYFTVKITVTDPEGGTVNAMMEGYNYSDYVFSSNRGESFMLVNSKWYDCYNISGTNYHNVPIKAFTSNGISGTNILSYDANGGTNAPSPQTGNTDFTLSSTVPSRFGYTFLGWADVSAAASASFLPGDTVVLSGDTTLYAVWKAASAIDTSASYDASIDFSNQEIFYSFTPSSSGKYHLESSGSLDTRIFLYNASGSQLGYDDDSGSGVNFRLTSTLSAGTKYYIKVRAYSSNTGSFSFSIKEDTTVTYTVSYNANGGTNAPSEQIKVTDVGLTLSPVRPVKSYIITYNTNGGSVSSASKVVSCAFREWNTDQNGNGTSYMPGSTYSENSSVTLYAQWSDPTFGNLHTPTRPGYIFDGWFTSPSGGTKITSSTTLTGNTTIYAQWTKAVTYTVSYDANGGTNAPSSQTKTKDVPLTLTSAKPSKNYTVTYNANGGSVSPASKSVSCIFKNWNTSQDGSGTSYASGGIYSENRDITLYAQWNNPTYGTLPTPTKSGYIFDGWFTKSEGGSIITNNTILTDNTTIFAHWTESPYEGFCGPSLLWNFDPATGQLRISGTGNTYNFNVPEDPAPWYGFKEDITAIIIDEGVTGIGRFAFADCYSSTSVTLPESLKTIGERAFYSSASLKKIYIPSHVSSIGTAAFALCSDLKEINVDPMNSNFCNDSYGVLFNKQQTTLIHYPAGRTSDSYTIPDSTTAIAPYAFIYCDNIKNFTVPKSVNRIGEYAFDREIYHISVINYNGSPTQWNNADVKKGNEHLYLPHNMNFTETVVYKTELSLTNNVLSDYSDLSFNWIVAEGKAKISADKTSCLVTFNSKDNVSINFTAVGNDFSESVTYNFTVKYTWWQWIIIILLFGWIWY
ncbi:MAG: InlB B-repeat-containing protein [Clostridia bacterium]|nr:InlB B-repeat-containing protein [Clostridia bacterium]